MRREFLAWGPVVIWALVLAGLSRLTAVPAPLEPLTVLSDKVIHFGLYTVMGAALAWARAVGRRDPPHLAMMALGSLYGALDEFHQSFVPGRTPEVGDWVANTLGVVAGYVLLTLLLDSRPNPFTRRGGSE